MIAYGPLELVTAPLGRVVALAQAKTHCRVDSDVTIDDTYIGDLIEQAQEFAENLVHGERQWMPALYDLPLAEFPLDVFRFPRPPGLAVKSVTYYDSSNVSQTLSTSYYNVRTPWRQPMTLERAPEQEWPTTYFDRPYPITVRFWAGYGATMTAATSDVITVSGRQFADNTVVRFVSTTTLPAGLSAYTDYYVRDTSAATFKVATTVGGTAVDITDTGTGTHFVVMPPKPVKQAILMLVAAYYAKREPSEDEMETVQRLLDTQLWGSHI